MRRWAFIVAVIGMFILALNLGFNVKEINSYEELSDLEINQRVFLQGEVVDERQITSGKLLYLDGGFEMVCECAGNFAGREVEVEGVVSEFDGKRQVSVLKIVVKDDN